MQYGWAAVNVAKSVGSLQSGTKTFARHPRPVKTSNFDTTHHFSQNMLIFEYSSDMIYRPNKPKNGGITAGISRAGPVRDFGIGNGAESGAEVRQKQLIPSALSLFACVA